MRSDRPLRILVVDDERSVADSTALILMNHGHSARSVYTPEDAIRLAREFRPDVLISDVIMSGINGVELARHFSDHSPTAKCY